MSDADAKRQEDREREKKEEKAKKKAKAKEHRELSVQRVMNWNVESQAAPFRALSLMTLDSDSESDETVIQASDSKKSKGKEPEDRTSESVSNEVFDQRVKAWKDALSTLPVVGSAPVMNSQWLS